MLTFLQLPRVCLLFLVAGYRADICSSSQVATCPEAASALVCSTLSKGRHLMTFEQEACSFLTVVREGKLVRPRHQPGQDPDQRYDSPVENIKKHARRREMSFCLQASSLPW